MEIQKENKELAQKILTLFAEKFSLDEEWLRITETTRFFASGDKKASAWTLYFGKTSILWWYAMENPKFFANTEDPTKRFYIDDGMNRLFTPQKFLEIVEEKYLRKPLSGFDVVFEMTKRIREKATALEKQLREAQAEILELKYRPGGPGYEEAKQDFEELSV
ncbi:hypothetical protein LAU_0068 [Lausannevirus]|uniref:Uncharacterized protein n=2 Tax=Lausannevirus TaxID=999883 RepID=A0A0N9P6H4_9VIRU|nr:hypothetical protein LAU_0068 [Lausannevirus]AEA06923.1 hypothetical protein LAU_0068 [Lausannevirus]ALH06761.1 hypothetical protein PMV_063 [Port-miou virus]